MSHSGDQPHAAPTHLKLRSSRNGSVELLSGSIVDREHVKLAASKMKSSRSSRSLSDISEERSFAWDQSVAVMAYDGLSLALLVNHDDGDREHSYESVPAYSLLTRASPTLLPDWGGR